MTASSTGPSIRKGRTFGLFRVLAPVLTLLAFVLAIMADDPARSLAATGQGMMMLAITLYAFRLKGRPVTARPPVHFTPEARLYVVLLALGAMLWAFAVAGLPGATIIALVATGGTLWMRSTSGLSWRRTLAGAG